MPRGNTVVSDVLSASTQLFLLYALIGVYDGHGILSAVHVHLGQEAGGLEIALILSHVFLEVDAVRRYLLLAALATTFVLNRIWITNCILFEMRCGSHRHRCHKRGSCLQTRCTRSSRLLLSPFRIGAENTHFA